MAELGQAQLKLELDISLIFSRFCSIVLNRFGSVYLVLYISNILLGRFDFVDSVLKVWFGKFGSINLVWYILFSSQGTKLVEFGTFGLVN